MNRYPTVASPLLSKSPIGIGLPGESSSANTAAEKARRAAATKSTFLISKETDRSSNHESLRDNERILRWFENSAGYGEPQTVPEIRYDIAGTTGGPLGEPAASDSGSRADCDS